MFINFIANCSCKLYILLEIILQIVLALSVPVEVICEEVPKYVIKFTTSSSMISFLSDNLEIFKKELNVE